MATWPRTGVPLVPPTRSSSSLPWSAERGITSSQRCLSGRVGSPHAVSSAVLISRSMPGHSRRRVMRARSSDAPRHDEPTLVEKPAAGRDRSPTTDLDRSADASEKRSARRILYERLTNLVPTSSAPGSSARRRHVACLAKSLCHRVKFPARPRAPRGLSCRPLARSPTLHTLLCDHPTGRAAKKHPLPGASAPRLR